MPELEPGRNVWRVETAGRFSFVVDGADYFVALRQAMLSAQKSILLVGWDFDSRIILGDAAADGGPERLGAFILWLAKRRPGLEIRLLRWDTGAIKAMLNPSNLAAVLRWKAHPRITLRLDAMHPFGGSHHQKIVAIDDDMAFCGGIDITVGRWDTREHPDFDPRRNAPDGREHGPWHDATSAFDGAAARAIGDLARDRWKAATGETLAPVQGGGDCWPAALKPTFRNVSLGLARTLPKLADRAPVLEVEASFLELIRGAKRFIYAESQYFASRRIARAIAERLVEPDGPEIVLVNPQAVEGWLEPLAMDTARARLVGALRQIDRRGRFRIYCPQTETGRQIFVHAKVMVVDDAWLRVGSSNFNNRSMRFDSECDVILQGRTDGERAGIAGLRNDLMAEHLGTTPAAVAEAFGRSGSLIATVEALRREEGRSLVPYRMPEVSGLAAWLADNEILDPDGPDAVFEPLSRRGLFRGWGRVRARLHAFRIARRARRQARRTD